MTTYNSSTLLSHNMAHLNGNLTPYKTKWGSHSLVDAMSKAKKANLSFAGKNSQTDVCYINGVKKTDTHNNQSINAKKALNLYI